MSQLKIRVLGGFGVVDDNDRTIRFHTRKAAALLAYLAISPGKEFSREHLMNLLWSDRGEAQASNSLRQALSQLRKALKGQAVSLLNISPEGIGIDPEAVSVDAVEFERLATGKEKDRRRAISLYRGDFLADFTVRDNAFEEWRRRQAIAIGALAVDTFDILLNEAIDEQDFDGALELAKVLLKIDPAHEGAHRALMRIHSRKGRRGVALQQYEICREFLTRELSVEPEPETEELRRTILSGEPRLAPSARVEPINALGVLPFTTLDDDMEAQRMASGLAASIAIELGRFRSLSVVAASSSLSFKDSQIDIRDIAESLHARYLVDGSVDRSGDRLIGFVRLTEPRSGRQVWSDRFEAGAEDVLAVIDNVVRSIVGPLVARLESEEIAVVRRKPGVNLDAYEHWLLGLSHLRNVSADDEKAAREHFQSAIDLDPDFARAHAGLAMAYFNSWTCASWGTWHESIARCLKAANRALALDPSDHWPHMVIASAYLFRREFDKSKVHFDRAMQLNPNDADLLALSSMLLTYYGDPEAGVEAGLTAMRLNPFYTDVHLDQIMVAFQMAGRYEETLELINLMSEPLTGDLSWEVFLHVEMGNLDHAKKIAMDFHEEIKGVWPQASSNNDVREIIETINPWKRREDHDRFFSALDSVGLFEESERSETVQRLAVTR